MGKIGFKIPKFETTKVPEDSIEDDMGDVIVFVNSSKSKKIIVSYIKDDAIVVAHIIMVNCSDESVSLCVESTNAKLLEKNEWSLGLSKPKIEEWDWNGRIVGARQTILPDSVPIPYSKNSFGTDPINIPPKNKVERDLVFRIEKDQSQLCLSIFYNLNGEKKVIYNTPIDISHISIENR